MKEIEMTKMVEEMDLRNLTPEVDMTDLVIATPDINRPALQLTGYYEHFANERVQIIGYVEFTYLQHLEEGERVRAFEEFVSRKIPCVIFTTKMIPGPEILELCNRYQVPAFAVDKSTSVFMAEIIRWLNVQLAPMISIHGVLVDVFGEGVLIMGESGIGKSEAALEQRHYAGRNGTGYHASLYRAAWYRYHRRQDAVWCRERKGYPVYRPCYQA